MANKLPDSGPISMLDIYNILGPDPKKCDYAYGCTKAANYNEIPSNFGGPSTNPPVTLNENTVKIKNYNSNTISTKTITKQIPKIIPIHPISLNDKDFRELAGISNGRISLSDFYGKSNSDYSGNIQFYVDYIENWMILTYNKTQEIGQMIPNIILNREIEEFQISVDLAYANLRITPVDINSTPFYSNGTISINNTEFILKQTYEHEKNYYSILHNTMSQLQVADWIRTNINDKINNISITFSK